MADRHDVVILWYSPDRDVVRPLIERLKDLGLSTWDYEHDMQAGLVIKDEIKERIDAAKLVLLCVSDAAAPREWLITEAAWCDQRFTSKPNGILLAQVGPFDKTNLPATLKGRCVFDVTDGEPEERTLCLSEDIAQRLGAGRPIVLTAVAIAMTQTESGQVDKKTGNAYKLCRSAGIPRREVPAFLSGRYGNNRRDFKPFGDQTCFEFVRSRVRCVNKAGRRPIALRWMCQDFNGPNTPATRDEWRENDSILFVDVLSMHHPAVCELLGRIPPANHMHRNTVICFPPPPVADFGDRIRVALELHAPFGDCVRDWEQERHFEIDRRIIVDTASRLGLRDYLHFALAGVGAPRPDPQIVAKLQGNTGPHIIHAPGRTK